MAQHCNVYKSNKKNYENTEKIQEGIAGKLKNKKGIQITTTSEGATVEEPRIMGEDFEVKEQTSVTETDNQSYEDVNENSEDLQPVYEAEKRL